jgi:hypothetical protein
LQIDGADAGFAEGIRYPDGRKQWALCLIAASGNSPDLRQPFAPCRSAEMRTVDEMPVIRAEPLSDG